MSRPAPLTPADCDLKGLTFMPLDVLRLRDSDLALSATGDEFKAAVLLWCASWHQTPAASLPNDDRLLALLARVDAKTWKKVRTLALWNWVECDDGRLYHPVVAEKALEAWQDRQAYRRKREADKKRLKEWRDRRAGNGDETPDETGFETPDETRFETRKTEDGTGSGGTTTSDPVGSGAVAPGRPDFDKQAWDKVRTLLSAAGEKPANIGTFFGGLLRDHGLEPKDLLPSLTLAEIRGTPDPKAYLKKAAIALGERRKASPKPGEVVDVDSWSDETWAEALRIFREDGRWGDSMGPKPGEPGCRVPSKLLVSAA